MTEASAPERPRTEVGSWEYPDWVVLHVPHDSAEIPESVRRQFILNDAQLAQEVLDLTDHHTFRLFAGGAKPDRLVRASVSRLVVDVERFESDADEPMANRGMGVVYSATAHGARLRRPITEGERDALLDLYYRPHHEALTEAVDAALCRFGRCLVLDCHSFPSQPLPCDLDQDPQRPDICIGTDAFHTMPAVRDAFVREFKDRGFTVYENAPFSGALVPVKHYRLDRAVAAVMVEVNRSLYMDEGTGQVLAHFAETADAISRCCKGAIDRLDTEFRP